MARGFTLLELLVVVLIIGLLSGLVAPRYFESVAKSKVGVAYAQMDLLEKAVDQFRLDTGAFPSQTLGLSALQTKPLNLKGWRGPYLKRDVPLDPWGHAYIYQLKTGGRDIDIRSNGSDGKPGGTDDAEDLSMRRPR